MLAVEEEDEYLEQEIEELFMESLEDERLRAAQYRFEYQEELFPDRKTGKLRWFKSNIYKNSTLIEKTNIRSDSFMKKFLMIVSIITIIMCDVYVCYANDVKIEATSTDANVENEIIENKEELVYEKELEDCVNNVIQNIPLDSRAGDPEMSVLKYQLYELKQVYPDFSYEQLLELMDTIETEEDYYRLLGQEESYEEDSNFPMLYASAIPVTSTESVLNSSVWNNTLNYNCAVIKNNNQNFYLFKNILANSNYIIPGLTVTNVNGEECRKMVPQGICIAGEYLLISAYCSDNTHNSVIYVVKLSTMKFTCTIKLDITAHVGGIAYDPVNKNLWVCNSDTDSLYAYNLSDLSSKATNASTNVNKSFYMYHYASSSVSVAPSFCVYYNGMIWVGNFKTKEEGIVIGYVVNGVNLIQGARFKSPANSQGIAFFKYNGKIYCAISSSYGRTNNSDMYTYEIVNYEKESKQNIIMVRSLKKTIKMPSMLEGLQTSGYGVYAIFESAANKYRNGDKQGNSVNPCDRICKFTTSLIFK